MNKQLVALFLLHSVFLTAEVEIIYGFVRRVFRFDSKRTLTPDVYRMVFIFNAVAFVGGLVIIKVENVQVAVGLGLIVSGLMLGAWANAYKNRLFGSLLWLYLVSEIVLAFLISIQITAINYIIFYGIVFAIGCAIAGISSKRESIPK